MADHAELAAELDHVEKMSTQERLKHARKRRQHQLKKYLQYDKQQEKDNKKKPKKRGKDAAAAAENNKKNKRNVQFITSVMLLDAAARNDVKEVRELLKKGVSPNVANEDGLTALHQCCIDDYENMMKALIEFGANVNATDTEQWTPLHAAATCGHVHLCKYLIDHGAELLAVNADGNMPYDICEDEVTLDFIETEMSVRGITQEMIDETRLLTEKAMLADMQTLLREQGNFDFRDKHGASVLHIATANGYVDVVEYLLKNHHPVDLRDNDEWQPVHAAACWGHLNILESLVQHGADLDARTKNGETPADICEDLEIQRRIIELKEEVRTHRTTRGSVEHRHRRSNNPRSASVRRTSMREKNAISRKEAREEARIRDSVASDDGILMPTSNIDDVKLDIPETEELTVSPTTITSDQTPTVTSNKPHQNGSSTHDAAAFTSSSAENIIQHPLTNISGYDDPQPPTSHSDPHRPPTADVTNVTPTPPPTSVTDHQEHPMSSTQRVRPPSPQRHQQHHQPEPAVAVNRTEPEPPVQPPPTAVTVEPTPPPTLAPVSAKKPKPADRQIAPVKPQPQERKDKPNVGVRTENNNDKANKPNASNAENTKRPGERQQREEKAQRRKNNVDVINAMGNSSEIAVVAPQQQPKKETNNREQPSPARSTGYDNQISKIKQHPPMNDMTHLTWNPSTMPPTGTLADLKNQRNRMREQSHRSGSIDHGHSGSNGKLANSSADLHDSGSIGGNQPQHNGSHSPASSTVLYGHDGTSTTSLEPPRRVFHANEVIGAEEKKGCCVIL